MADGIPPAREAAPRTPTRTLAFDSGRKAARVPGSRGDLFQVHRHQGQINRDGSLIAMQGSHGDPGISSLSPGSLSKLNSLALPAIDFPVSMRMRNYRVHRSILTSPERQLS